MTRKDYVLIAAALKDARPYAANQTASDVLANVAANLADMLKRENPRFDRTRFMAAAGVQS